MAENESIGGIKVDIEGDYSKLQDDIQSAQQMAAAGATAIAESFTAAAAQADTLSDSVSKASDAAGDFEARISELVATGSTLAEALATVAAETEAVVTGIAAAGDAASTAAQQLSLFDEALSVPYADATGQLNLFATELEPIGSDARAAAAGLDALTEAEKAAGDGAAAGASGLRTYSEAAQAVIDTQIKLEQEQATAAGALRELYTAYQEGAISAATLARAQDELATASKNVGESASETKPPVDDLLKTILDFAGITVSIAALKSFVEETLNLYAAEQRAAEGLAFLRGNIADTDAVLADLRNTAQSLALPFDQVAGAAQKMQFLGLSAEQTAMAIATADDAAKASGKSFSSMADSLNNIAQVGNAMPRTLRQIGVSVEDLADVLGVTVDKVKAVFKEMDQPDRLNALIAAMDNTRGASAAMADDLTSNITRAKNSWDFALTDMGGAIAPLALEAIPELVSAFKSIVSGGVLVVVGLKVIVDGIVGLTTVALQSAAGLGKVWLNVMTGDFSAAATAASDALGNVRAAGKFTWDSIIADAQNGADALDKIWAEQAKTAKSASDDEIAAAAKAAAAAAQAAAARQAASAETKKELAEVATFAKSIAVALAASDQSYEDYVVGLLDGGKKASAVLKTLTEDIAKGEAEASKMSGAPKAAMEEWIAELQKAQATMRDFAETDDFTAAWTKILDQRTAYAAKVAAEAQKIDDAMAADQRKAALEAEQGALKHSETLLEIQRTAAAEEEKIHNITAFDKLAIDKDLDDKEATLAREALDKELALIDEAEAATEDEYSKREAVILKIQALQDKINGKAVVDAITAQTTAYQVLGVESTKALDTQIRAADQALQILKSQNAAIGDIYAGEEKELQLRIKRDELTGASATAEILALEKIKLSQQALYDQTHLLGDTYTAVINDTIKNFENMGGAISKVIVEGGNMAAAFKQAGKQILETIITDIINAGLKAIVDMIVQSVIPTFGTTLPAIAGVTTAIGGMQAAMATATAAMQAEIASLNAAFASLAATIGGTTSASGAGAGSQASGTASGIASGPIGLGASIVSAISSIIGNFQMAHLEKIETNVELNTRITARVLEAVKQDLWDQQTGVVVTLGMIFDRLGDIWNTILQNGLGGGSGPQSGSGDGASGSFTNPTTNAPGGAPSGGSNTGGNLPTNPTNGVGGYNPYSGVGGAIWNGVLTPNIPPVPSAPYTMTSPAANTYGPSSYSSTSNGGTQTFYIYESSNPRETARQVASVLRVGSGQFAPNAS